MTDLKGGGIAYLLTPELDGMSLLNVRPGGTMDVLLDGIPSQFVTPTQSTFINKYGPQRSYMHEVTAFPVSPADLAKLSTATSIQFRVNGTRQAVQRCIDSKRLRDLPEFLSAAALYATTQPTPAPPSVATSNRYVESVDPSTQLKQLKLNDIPFGPCANDPALGSGDADVHLAVAAEQRRFGPVFYSMTLDVAHGPHLNPQNGDAMEAAMGQQTASFPVRAHSIVASVVDAEGHTVSHEKINLYAHLPDLIALSKASMVEFRIGNPDHILHRCSSAQDLQDLARFIADAETLRRPIAGVSGR